MGWSRLEALQAAQVAPVATQLLHAYIVETPAAGLNHVVPHSGDMYARAYGMHALTSM